MKKFEFHIEEIFTKALIVEAEDWDEARQLVKNNLKYIDVVKFGDDSSSDIIGDAELDNSDLKIDIDKDFIYQSIYELIDSIWEIITTDEQITNKIGIFVNEEKSYEEFVQVMKTVFPKTKCAPIMFNTTTGIKTIFIGENDKDGIMLIPEIDKIIKTGIKLKE